MKIYNLLLVVLMAAFLIVFTACGGDKDKGDATENNESDGTSGVTVESATAENTPEASETEEESYETQIAEDIASMYPDGLPEQSEILYENPDGSSNPSEVIEPDTPTQNEPEATKPVPETTVIIPVPETTNPHLAPTHSNGIQLPPATIEWD